MCGTPLVYFHWPSITILELTYILIGPRVEVQGLRVRYSADLPEVIKGVSFVCEPGRCRISFLGTLYPKFVRLRVRYLRVVETRVQLNSAPNPTYVLPIQY